MPLIPTKFSCWLCFFGVCIAACMSTAVRTGRPSIGHISSDIEVSCTLEEVQGEVLGEVQSVRWTRISDQLEITGVEGGFSEDGGPLGQFSYLSTLYIVAEENYQDERYKCEFGLSDGSKYTGVALVFLFRVTPHGARVDKGGDASLTCVFTDIVKNLTVTWEMEGQDISEISGHSFIQGVNVGGVQVSKLAVTSPAESAEYTCSIYPYIDQPYRTTLQLTVNGVQ